MRAVPPGQEGAPAQFFQGHEAADVSFPGACFAPRFLLLDEAFDGLDPQSRLEFKRALISLTEEQNCTTVIASHSLRELTDICTHFALISGGRVADSGDLQEKLGAVYKFQIGLSEEASPALFPFPCLKCECSGRVAQIIVRGNREEIVQKLEALSPLFVEEIPVDFEEYFLIEADKGREENEKTTSF